MQSLQAISPIDGRYRSKTKKLENYFSEFALIKYRVLVEIKYFQALYALPLPQLQKIPATTIKELDDIVSNFSLENAQRIKDIEKTTNHDVKAVEYFLKEELQKKGLDRQLEFIHFGLTSQDINNTAVPLSLKDALEHEILPELQQTVEQMGNLAQEWQEIPMLAKTHGQPASPTLLGKEFEVFVRRIEAQLTLLRQIPYAAKFGGATGNMNAHYVTFPDIDWHDFADQFVSESLNLHRSFPTTQIEHYDHLGAIFHNFSRINTILIDFCRDIWTYVSMEYFRQKTIAGEIGSSAMPHKVNPIDFENAEGNLGIANAIFEHLAAKLPVSRLQRDLTDSTVLRNIGVPFGHVLIALKSIQKGMSKLLLNESKLNADLEANWIVVAEGIQNILRREGFDKPYEALKALTRGKASVGQVEIHAFINSLAVSDAVRAELLQITPQNYTGRGKGEVVKW